MKLVVLKKGVHTRYHEAETGNVEKAYTQICSSVVLLKAEAPREKNIIIDPGNLSFEHEILDAMKKEDVDPMEVEIVINTHYHLDHTSNNYLFPLAQRIYGREVWSRNGKHYVFKDMFELNDLGVKDVTMIKTPGHTPKHYSVVFTDKDKKIYVIAGDAIRPHDFAEGFFSNDEDIASAQKILDMADVIIPGHGDVMEKKEIDEMKMRLPRKH